jgi:hypothetical protein
MWRELSYTFSIPNLINMNTLFYMFHTFHLLPTPLFPFFIIGLCIPRQGKARRGKDIVVFRFIIIESIVVVVAYGILAPAL